MITAAGCPTPEQLRDMLEKTLEGSEAEAVEHHVGTCPACQHVLEKLTADPSSGPTTLDIGSAPPLRDGASTLDRLPDVGRPAPMVEARPTVPGYAIEGILGRGGMGVVYFARQLHANRQVALKMVLTPDRGRPEDLLRFRLEAESLARLHHPNIVQVFEVGSVDERPFFSMEYVPGGTLAEAMAGGPKAPTEAAAMARTLARAVHAAHQSGVVHRDLKPANVLLASPPGTEQETPKVTDFGLAKVIGEDSGLTRTGQVMGTPSYMAPEQANGGVPVGVPADVHALGAILYELLAGRPPYRGGSPWETMMQVVHQPLTPPSRWRPGLPRDLEVICLKCLAKEPSGRYASADALAEDLRRYLDGEPTLARPSGPFRRAGLWARRRPALAGLAILLMSSVLAGATGIVVQWRRAEANLAESRANLGLARRAVDDLLTKISQNKLIVQPGMQGLRRELLESAAGYYRELADRRVDDPSSRADAVIARTRVGQIDLDIASPEQAEAVLRQAVAAAGDPPRATKLERARAAAQVRLASAILRRGRPEEALKVVEEALASTRATHPARGDVDARRLEADCLIQRATILGDLMRPPDQERDYRESIRILDDLDLVRPGDAEIARYRAQSSYLLADVLVRAAGRAEDTRAVIDEAIAKYRAIVGGSGSQPDDRGLLAGVEMMLGNYLGFVLNRWDEARDALGSARKSLEILVAENPMVVDYRRELLNTYYTLGYTELRRARYADASIFYRKADDVVDRLIRDDPDGATRYAIERGGIRIELAEVRRHLGEPREARDILRDRSIPAVEAAARAAPSLTRLQLLLAMTHRYLSTALLDLGEVPTAVEMARRADSLLGPVADRPEADAMHREELGRIRIALGDALRAAGDDAGAEVALGRAIPILEDLNEANREATDRADALAYALARRASIRRKLGRSADGDADAARARALLEALKIEDPDLLIHLAVARLVDGQPAGHAVEAIRLAVEKGMASPIPLRADPDLAPLRGDPTFERLVRRVEARSKEATR